VDTFSPVTGFAGVLRAHDPRRFVIEAMLGAIYADGKVGARELQLLSNHVANHPLLRGLPPASVASLLQIANDTYDFASDPHARAAAIAKGLPSRAHRLMTFALTCEVVAIDDLVVDAERAFIEELRIALRVNSSETESLLHAIEQHDLQAYVTDRLARLRTLVPSASELFAIRAFVKQRRDDRHRFEVRDFFLAMPDLAAPMAELDGELYRTFRHSSRDMRSADDQIAELAEGVIDLVDRYWLVVYAMAFDLQHDDGRSQDDHWRLDPFLAMLQRGFRIVDADMQRASQDASNFSSPILHG
jgi:tellurite resistance protein